MSDVAVEIVRIIPSVLWFSLVAALLRSLYKPIREELLPNLSRFATMGVEFSFVRDSIDAAIELAEKHPKWKVAISATAKRRALNRVRRHLNFFRDVQILWLDDSPEYSINERRMFSSLRAEIDVAKSTEEALGHLRSGRHDLVISDMARGDDAQAGLAFLEQFRNESKTIPVIFYVGLFEPGRGVPPHAFGITNRPDELLHLTLDALERQKH
jgi:CheY-like chemotaxis protein